MMTPADITELQSNLGYSFIAPGRLHTALSHSSFVNEQNDPQLHDNERLEFLGDAVLNLVIGHLLLERHPAMHEGDLSRVRAGLVNEMQLACVARHLTLGRFIKLGKGEAQTGGHEKNSILADTLEAVVAAVYLDGGFAAAFALVQTHFGGLIDSAVHTTTGLDYKSRLQEILQHLRREAPQYQVVAEAGPDHDKTFRVLMTTGDMRTEGTGKTKKTAEQEAARKGLELIDLRSV